MENEPGVINQDETQNGQDDWRKVATRYVKFWLETRSGIPKAHSWDHAKMAATISSKIGEAMGLSEDELGALYIASLAHDSIQPALIPEDKKDSPLFADNEDRPMREKISAAWGYDPEGDEAIESAKATRYVLSSPEAKGRINFLNEEMVNRIVESISGHSVRIGPGGELIKSESETKFQDWDPMAKALYATDKLVNQDATIFFAFCNFTPKPGSNQRGFAEMNRLDSEETGKFLNKWYSKREHLMEEPELAELMVKGDPEIAEKLDFLRRAVAQYHREVDLIGSRPELQEFADSYGMLSVLRLSQERGNDRENWGEFKIAGEFIERIDEAEIKERELVGSDEEKSRIFSFAKEYKKRLKKVLEQYGEPQKNKN